MPKARISTVRGRLPAAGLAVLLWAVSSGLWGQTDEVSAFYEDAVKRFHENDYRGAVIQLKNALQKDPNHLPARILLGRVHLRVGDGAGAEKELLLARVMGADEPLIAVPLARSYFQQRRYKELVTQIHAVGHRPSIAAEILNLRGQAFHALGDLAAADKSYREALELLPGSVPALLGKARIERNQGRPEAATALIERAKTVDPSNPYAWFLDGELLREQGRLESALLAYDRVLEIMPGHMQSRLSRATVLAQRGENARARKDVDIVLAFFPEDPEGIYLNALLLYQEGKREGAQAALGKAAAALASLSPEGLASNQRALLLAGFIAFRQRNLEATHRYLSEYLKRDPEHLAARKMLGTVLLQLGEPEEAVRTLKPAVTLSDGKDGKLFELLGRALMAKGDHAAATDMLERAAELIPQRAAIHTQLALSRIRLGQNDKAKQDLTAAFEIEDSDGTAGFLLAQVHLREGNFEAAMASAEALVARFPENPAAYNLLGSAHFGREKLEMARDMFEHALQIQPEYLRARLNLAELERREGKPGEARARLEAILRDDPDETRAMRQLAKLAQYQNRLPDAIRWLDKVRATDPKALGAQFDLVEIYLRLDQADKALEVTERMQEQAPENLEVLATQGRVELAAGKVQAAATTFKRMSRLAGYSASALHRIAQFQLRAEDLDGARWSLFKAVQANPAYLPAQAALVRVELRRGRFEAALERASAIRAKHPKTIIGDVLMGDVFLRMGRFVAAADAYTTAHRKKPNGALLVRVYGTLAQAGQGELGLQKLEDWIRDHADDLMVRRALASAYLKSGLVRKAQQEYERLSEAFPRDATVLNNLATIYHRLGDDRALALAEKAYAVAPSSGAVNDTLGWILVQREQSDRALPLLRQAFARSSSEVVVRYHLGVALSKLGRVEEARIELEAALAADPGFEGSADARAVLAALSQGNR